jgi:hypothetical protein
LARLASGTTWKNTTTEVLLAPVQAPNANAHAEHWVRTVRSERLDWLLIVGRGHLEQVLRIYVQHYNRHRPHRALELEPPDPSAHARTLTQESSTDLFPLRLPWICQLPHPALTADRVGLAAPAGGPASSSGM